MKTIKINQLRIKNFKGLTSLEVNFKDRTIISGRNGTGKTSIFDAFLWLLFSKDSENRTDFAVKPMQDGKDVHNLETEVVGTFLIGGNEHCLKKILKEKWQKKRGEAEASLVGNETIYYIDEIIVKAKDFNQFIADNICNEELFKMLSNPRYFPGVIHWKQRREIILEVINFASIKDSLLSKYGIKDNENEKIRLQQYIRNAKKKAEEYPVRINELQAQITDDGIDIGRINNDIAITEQKMKELEGLISNDDYMKAYRTYIDAKNVIEKRLYEIEVMYKREAEEVREALNLIDRYKEEIEHIKSRNSVIETELQELRAKFREVKSQQFQVSDKDIVCSFCGQKLPQNLLNENIEKLKAAFFEDIRQELSKINDKGQSLRMELESNSKKIDELNNKIKEFEEKVKANKSVNDNAEYQRLKAELSALKEPKRNVADEEAIKERIDNLSNVYKELLSKKSQHENNLKLKNRIEELKKEWALLTKEMTEHEKALANIEEFEIELSATVEKIAMEKFAIEIKMFKELMNRGFEPCCEILVNGVTYQDANNSAKINTGIKLINKLSEYYQLSVPVFVDNAESINDIANCDSQLIAMYVTDDANLKIN